MCTDSLNSSTDEIINDNDTETESNEDINDTVVKPKRRYVRSKPLKKKKKSYRKKRRGPKKKRGRKPKPKKRGPKPKPKKRGRPPIIKRGPKPKRRPRGRPPRKKKKEKPGPKPDLAKRHEKRKIAGYKKVASKKATYWRRLKKLLAKRSNNIFDESAKDFTYIENNKSLLKKHLKYIATCIDRIGLYKYNLQCNCKILSFTTFKTRYKPIYKLWVHMIRSCYDESYIYYKFFGAKGIIVSKEFLHGKSFCMWCLNNKMFKLPHTYEVYFQRKDKSKGYSPENCYVTSEKEVHYSKDLDKVLLRIWLIKKYQEEHHEKVSYLAFYTRYWMFDFDIDDSRLYYKYSYFKINFRPELFYSAMADENSCSLTTFLSRLNYSYNGGGIKVNIYDLLRPDYDLKDDAAAQGKLTYKQQYHRRKKEEERKNKIYNNTQNNPNPVYNIINNDVYTNNDDIYST